MNTKSIIGLIIVVIIIVLIAVWLVKAPKTPDEPMNTAPVTTAVPITDTTVAPQTAQSAPVVPTAPTNGKIISTKTIDGMTIETTKEGTGPAITNGQTAAMLYTGTLADGTVFDSTASRNNQPFTFTLGTGMVIKGWDEGVLGMKVGEERILVIPADLAYGAAGYPPVIPQNATLTFAVTLVGIK